MIRTVRSGYFLKSKTTSDRFRSNKGLKLVSMGVLNDRITARSNVKILVI